MTFLAEKDGAMRWFYGTRIEAIPTERGCTLSSAIRSQSGEEFELEESVKETKAVSFRCGPEFKRIWEQKWTDEPCDTGTERIKIIIAYLCIISRMKRIPCYDKANCKEQMRYYHVETNRKKDEKMDGFYVYGTWWSPYAIWHVNACVSHKEVLTAPCLPGVAVEHCCIQIFLHEILLCHFEIMKDSMNLNILIFDVLLGMIIVLMANQEVLLPMEMGEKTDQEQKSALLLTTGLQGADFAMII